LLYFYDSVARAPHNQQKADHSKQGERMIHSWGRSFIQLLGAWMVGGVLAAFVVWIDPWLDQTTPAVDVVLNVTPALALYLVLLGALARPSPALLASLGVVGGVFYLNTIKLAELEQPLLFTDLFLVGQVVNHIDFLSAYINVPLISIAAVGGGIGMVVLQRTEPRWLNTPGQYLSGLIGCLAFGVLFTDLGQTIYQNDTTPDRPWAPAAAIEARGWLAGAVASMQTDWVGLPTPNRKAVAELRKAWLSELQPTALTQSPADSPTKAQPDVVIILSESFFEPRYLNGANLCTLLPRWCGLLAEGIRGEMTVPTFGGNTTRTEYELLTGVPYAQLPNGIYPYTSVVLQPTASIVWWAKYLGYDTTAIHPHDPQFWQRHRALPLLGFDQFIDEEEFGGHQRSGFWISDDDLTDKVLEVLNKNSDTPQWVLGISMENHGPWQAQRPNMDETRRLALPTIAGLDDQAAHAYRNYLYHQRNAVAALERLWRAIEQRDRPAVVLFFGDHLPGLHKTFEQAGFSNGFTPLTHPVPFLALSHHKPLNSEWQPKSAHQLGIWLMDHLGLALPDDYAMLRDYWRRQDQRDHAKLEALYPHLMTLAPEPWLQAPCQAPRRC
jgi:hypothetical protein